MNIKHFISIKIKQIPICLKSNFSLHHVRWIGVFHLMDINVILPKHFFRFSCTLEMVYFEYNKGCKMSLNYARVRWHNAFVKVVFNVRLTRQQNLFKEIRIIFYLNSQFPLYLWIYNICYLT